MLPQRWVYGGAPYAFTELGVAMLDRILEDIFSYPIRAIANELENRSPA
jgi:hypothetical protein